MGENVPSKGNAKTRERVLQAALDVFFEKGFFEARVDDVMARAGLSHGTFYTYFKNKRAALVELVERAVEALYEITEEPWRKGHSYLSLEQSIRGFLETYQQHYKVIKVWKEASVTDAGLADLWDRLVGKITSRIQKNIEASIRRSICRKVNPVIAARALAGMIEHYAYAMFFKGESADIGEVARTLAELWYHALYVQ